MLLGTWPESAVPRPPEQARTHMELLLSRPDRPREPLVELWREAVERGVWAIEDPADSGGRPLEAAGARSRRRRSRRWPGSR